MTVASRFALLVVLLSGAVLSGCGDYTRVDFDASAKALSSIAAEGALMAQDEARGRTLTSFVRAHGQDLSDQAEHEAEKMNDAPLAPGLAAKVHDALGLASSIGGLIDEIRVAPHNRLVAVRVERQLRRAALRASRLASG